MLVGVNSLHSKSNDNLEDELLDYEFAATPTSIPAMMYRRETWILRSQDCRIETSQMRFLRAVAGVTMSDGIRSEDVRKRLQTGNVVEGIKRYQRKWLEHVERVS
jgi:hypothetical protein